MNELALFAGAGGGLLASKILGWDTVCAVEIGAYQRKVLQARQKDGSLEKFPIWDDVCTFDGRQWRGKIDVISGGFPCQDISEAGKGKGITGERSGLWKEYARIISEVRPAFVFVENSPRLRTKGLVTVLKDLAELGYDARWGVLGAGHLGAPHERKRMWIVAIDPNLREHERREKKREVFSGGQQNAQYGGVRLKAWWKTQHEPRRVDNGVADRLDRAISIGNGQVPRVAATAFNVLAHNLHRLTPNPRGASLV